MSTPQRPRPQKNLTTPYTKTSASDPILTSQSVLKPKLSQSYSPLTKPLQNPNPEKRFSRFNSEQFLAEIFSGVKKPEENLVKITPSIKKLEENPFQLTPSPENPKKKQIKKEYYNTVYELPDSMDEQSVDQTDLRIDTSVCTNKRSKPANSLKSSLSSQKSDPRYLQLSERLSKDFSLVLRKKNANGKEEVCGREAEVTQLNHFVHETMNRIYCLKMRLVSFDSGFTVLGKSIGSGRDSVGDLKKRLWEDLDKINLMVDKVFCSLEELNESKLREKELKRQLNEMLVREDLLQTKLDFEKTKNSELSIDKTDTDRLNDKKENFFMKEKLEFQQKLTDLQTELTILYREKDQTLKNIQEKNLKTENLTFQIKTLEFDLQKSRESVFSLNNSIQILQEKLKTKEINEQFLALRLKNFEENSNFESKPKNFEKIAELEETLKSKNAEITELKYKLCRSKPLELEDQEKNTNFLTRLQEISTLAKSPENGEEKIVKTLRKEVKMLKIALDVLQQENFVLTKVKEKEILLENSKEMLANQLSQAEERVKTLEKENFKIRSELLDALSHAENAEQSKITLSASEKLKKEQIKLLQKTQESFVEQSEILKYQLDDKYSKLESLKSLLTHFQAESLQKSNEINTLTNELNRVKSTLASKDLEICFLADKETMYKSQIQECINEIKQIQIESKKIKENNSRQAEELTQKTYELSDLEEKTKNLRIQLQEKKEEIENLNKTLKESQQICNSQKSLLETLNQEKSEIFEKLAQTEQENVKIKENLKELEGMVKGKEEELKILMNKDKWIEDEIGEIEEEFKKMPRKNSLRSGEDLKQVHEEKFRLKSLLVYKNVQIKLLKDKLGEGKKTDVKLTDVLKRNKSLMGVKEKKGKL